MAHRLLSAAQLRMARTRSALTQAELADAVGLSRVSIGLMERGERAICLTHTLALARVLRLPEDF